MSYCTAAQLLDRYGAKELAEIATPDDLAVVSGPLMRLTVAGGDRSAHGADETAAADAALARIGAAIDQAGRLIDSYLGGRYALPLDGAVVAASPLPAGCGDLARETLHDDRLPEIVARRADAVRRWLRDLADGRVHLEGVAAAGETGAGMPGIRAGTAVFGDAMEGYT